MITINTNSTLNAGRNDSKKGLPAEPEANIFDLVGKPPANRRMFIPSGPVTVAPSERCAVRGTRTRRRG